MNEVIKIVEKTTGIANIDPNATFEEAGFSSMNVVELLFELESNLGIHIPDEEFLAARTLQELYGLISSLLEVPLV